MTHHLRTARHPAAPRDPWYGSHGAAPRDPALALYDPAAELVAAASALRGAASRPGTGPAVAATLGCVEAALRQLRAALDDLGYEVHGTERSTAFDDASRMLERAEADTRRAREGLAAIVSATVEQER